MAETLTRNTSPDGRYRHVYTGDTAEHYEHDTTTGRVSKSRTVERPGGFLQQVTDPAPLSVERFEALWARARPLLTIEEKAKALGLEPVDLSPITAELLVSAGVSAEWVAGSFTTGTVMLGPVPSFADDGGSSCSAPTPDYRAALEGLVKAHDHLAIVERTSERVYPGSYADARTRLAAALTAARKVLGG